MDLFMAMICNLNINRIILVENMNYDKKKSNLLIIKRLITKMNQRNCFIRFANDI